MAFPTLDSAVSKERALQNALSEARSLKRYLESTTSAMATNRLSVNAITQAAQNMRGIINMLDTLAAVPGIEEYAANSLGRGIRAGGAELKHKCEAAIAAIKPVFSADSKTGYIPAQKIEDNGDISTRSLSPEEMAPVRAALMEVLAALE